MSGLLGTGGFATVWRGHDDVLDAPVAIKVLADNWSRHLDVSERFLAEAKLLRQADSDRVLRVLDYGELEDGRPYFVTVLAEDGSLEDLLGQGELPVDEALRHLVEVAEAVVVLHSMHVVHRDLKPSNVLLDRGRVVLADLGLAKALAHSSGLTQVAGSPGYMAPEQAAPGGVVDERTDVYGLGALAHRLLAGSTVGQPPKRPLPGRLGRVVRRALRSDPRHRWPSARVLADELRDLAEHGWGTGRGRVALVGGAAVLTATGVVVSWLLWPTTHDQHAVVDPNLCRAADVKVAMGPVDTNPYEYTQRKSYLTMGWTGRPCQLFGRFRDVRFVLGDGSALPLRFGDGTGEPMPVEMLDDFAAEIPISWHIEDRNGATPPKVPVRLELGLPQVPDVVTMPWTYGPVGDRGQVEIDPIRPAAN
ncbi:serine/threonine-protein kinase [Allokutzneria oryzae]|uniref:non-specific serine/threonine protein kinase n=1 Tax=Allokutzneria oryzae TaxID=1378989 RepID=A0ABV6A8W7_9PSEU